MKTFLFISSVLLCAALARAQSTPVTANADGTLQGPTNFFTANGPAIATAAGVPSGAAPTALIGLSPAAGSAPTFMRSDAAPAIDQSISPTMTGNWQFNGAFGVNGLGTGSRVDTTVPTYFKRTSVTDTGVTLGADLEYIASFNSGNVGVGLLVDLINTSTTSNSMSGGHLPALIGRAQDNPSGQMAMVGVEGKIVRTGTVDAGSGVWAIADYNGSTFLNRSIRAYDGFCEVYSDPYNIHGTPVAQGATTVYHASLPTGGDPTQMYSLYTDAPGAGVTGWQLFNAGPVIVSDSAGDGKNLLLYHDGSDGQLAVNGGGALRLYTPGNYVVLQSGNGLVPAANGNSLGINGYAWNVAATSITDQGNLSVGGTLSAGAFSASGNSNVGGALNVSGALSTTLTTLTYASTVSLDPTRGNVFKTTTDPMIGGATMNATTAGTAGQTITIIIANDADSGETIAFGSNFKSTGTLAGTMSKTAVVSFVSDGTNFYETGRAAGE